MTRDSHQPTAECPLTRRQLLSRCGMGFGMVGLAGVLADEPGLTTDGDKPKNLVGRSGHQALVVLGEDDADGAGVRHGGDESVVLVEAYVAVGRGGRHLAVGA